MKVESHRISRTRISRPSLVKEGFVVTLAATALVVACGPKQNPALDALRADVVHAQGDAALVRRAPAAVDDTVRALTRAEDAYRRDMKPVEQDHTILMTRRQLEIAKAQSAEKSAEEEIARIGIRRDTDVANARARGADQRAATAQGELRATQRSLDEQSAMVRAGAAANAALDARASNAEDSAATARLNLEASQQTVEQQNQDAREAQRQRTALELDLARLRHELNAQETDRGLLITFGNDVLFDVGRSDIKTGARERLGRLSDFLHSYPDRFVRIEGHTDSTGSVATNRELSRARADAVRTVFIDQGVSASHITAQGLGSDSPVASNDSSTGRQQNRRVEIVLLDPSRSAADASK